MLKTGIYLLLLSAAATLAAVTAINIPHVFVQDQVNDLATDVIRANHLAQTELKVYAFEQVAATTQAASDRGLVQALTPGTEEAPRSTSMIAADVEAATARLAKSMHRDLVIVVGTDGKVISSAGAGPEKGTDLSNLPPVKDALRGYSRDWFWAQRGQAQAVAGAPIVVGNRIMGGIISGDAIDGALAARVAGVVDPVAQPGRRMHVALFHGESPLASSARDATIQSMVVDAIGGKSSAPLAEDITIANVQLTTLDDTQVARLVTALGGAESRTDLGIVIVGERVVTEDDAIKLAIAAYNLDSENADMLFAVLVFIVLFLIGWLLMNNEFQRPARKITAQLREVGKHIESGELDVRSFQGSYFDLAKELNSVLIGLRKRLERERAGIPTITGEAEPVGTPDYLQSSPSNAAISTAPAAPTAEAAPRRRPVPVKVSHVAAPVDEPEASPAPADAPLLTDLALEPVGDEEPPQASLTSLTDGDEPSEDLARIASEAAASLPSAELLPAITDSTVDIPGDQLIALISRGRQEGAAAAAAEDDEPASLEPASALEPTRLIAENDEEPLDDPLHEGSTGTDDATRVHGSSTDQSTVVDDIGVMRALASSGMASDEDPLQESAIAKASAAAAPAEEMSEVDTAEVSRNDEAFIQALAESAAPTPENALSDSLSPESLLEKLKQRGAVPSATEAKAEHVDTAVKKISPQLLRRAGNTGPNPFVHQAPTTPGTAPKKPESKDAAIDPDAEYFSKLFEQFVKTKEECGEDTEGLTLSRFVRRLEQNKKTLMSRYGCRSVRFQVYVKNGKAALKATPIK